MRGRSGACSLGIESRFGFGELHARQGELLIALALRLDQALDALVHGQRFEPRFFPALAGCGGVLGRSPPDALRDRACDGPVGQDDAAVRHALLEDLRIGAVGFLSNGSSGGCKESRCQGHVRGDVSDAPGVGHAFLNRCGAAKFQPRRVRSRTDTLLVGVRAQRRTVEAFAAAEGAEVRVRGQTGVQVMPGSPAQKAGLQPFMRGSEGGIAPGDVITAINDEQLTDLDSMLSALERFQPGDKSLWREGKTPRRRHSRAYPRNSQTAPATEPSISAKPAIRTPMESAACGARMPGLSP